MKKYEEVYSFHVLNEISNGEKIYIIDRSYYNSIYAIRIANDMNAQKLINIVNRNNDDNRFEFYKVVETDE